VLDALAPFDIDNLDVPMMPLKVWTAIRGAARQACKRRTAQATSSRKEGKWTMSLTIEAIDRTNRPFFAGVALDCDLSRPLSPSDISTIHAGWTVSACCYSATSRSMTAIRSTLTGVRGPIEQATGGIGAPEDRRLGMDLTEIFNLEKNERALAGLILGVVVAIRVLAHVRPQRALLKGT
jgi:hypothetical protein